MVLGCVNGDGSGMTRQQFPAGLELPEKPQVHILQWGHVSHAAEGDMEQKGATADAG